MLTYTPPTGEPIEVKSRTVTNPVQLLGQTRTSLGGVTRTSYVATRGAKKGWEIETPPLPRADGRALLAAVLIPGHGALNGDLVDNGPVSVALIGTPSLVDDARMAGYVVLTFAVVEVAPL